MGENDYIATIRKRNAALFAGGDESKLTIKVGTLELLLRQAFSEGAKSRKTTSSKISDFDAMFRRAWFKP